MTASDVANGATTSFNGAGNWSDAAAPSAANDYFTAGRLLRTPNNTASAATVTFAGNSLTIGNADASPATGALVLKGLTGSTATVNNLTLNGGAIFGSTSSSTSASRTITLGGSITVANGGGLLNSNNGTGTNVNFLDVAATIAGNGPLSVYAGPAILTYGDASSQGGTGTVRLNAANSYGGTITVTGSALSTNQGVLGLGNTNAAQNATILVNTTGNPGLGFRNNAAFTVGALGGTGNVNLSNTGIDGVALTVGGNNASTTFAGVIGNGLNLGGSLTKVGTGTMSLAGLNTYTGNTTVSAGELALADNAHLSFLIGASGVNNAIGGTAVLTLDGDFNLTLPGVAPAAGSSWTLVDVASVTEAFNSTFSVIGFSESANAWTKPIDAGSFYQFEESTGVLSVVAVPEPATLTLLALIGVVARRRRGSIA